MAKLHQILPVEAATKQRTHTALSKIYQQIQKDQLLFGLTRVYTPKEDGGDTLPPEGVKVQVSTDAAVLEAQVALERLFEVTFTKDLANQRAVADIVVEGNTLLAKVPVTYLLFLEKQLTDVRTFILKIPTLDPAEQWEWSPQAGVYKTEPVQTVRAKKVPRNHIKYEATAQHPAQVEMYMEDVPVGTWSTTKFSGAQPKNTIDFWVGRVEKLLDAVRVARAEANSLEVETATGTARLLEYVFETPSEA